MQEIFVAMAIMGCGDAGTACETLRIMDADFQTVDECNAAAPDILMRLTDLDYPEVHIDCDARPKLAAQMGAGRLG